MWFILDGDSWISSLFIQRLYYSIWVDGKELTVWFLAPIYKVYYSPLHLTIKNFVCLYSPGISLIPNCFAKAISNYYFYHIGLSMFSSKPIDKCMKNGPLLLSSHLTYLWEDIYFLTNCFFYWDTEELASFPCVIFIHLLALKASVAHMRECIFKWENQSWNS